MLERWLSLTRRLPAPRRLAWYPPFWLMRIQVLELGDDWRHVRIRLPLQPFTRNPGGGMFGGAIAALADPIAPLACNRLFPGHAVWTRGLSLDFRREGRTDLELRFDVDPQQEAAIAAELARRGRATPQFEYALYDASDTLCVGVTNAVAIRPLNYRPEAPRHAGMPGAAADKERP